MIMYVRNVSAYEHELHMSRNILDGGFFEFKPPAVGILKFKYSEKATKIRWNLQI